MNLGFTLGGDPIIAEYGSKPTNDAEFVQPMADGGKRRGEYAYGIVSEHTATTNTITDWNRGICWVRDKQTNETLVYDLDPVGNKWDRRITATSKKGFREMER